MLHFSWCNFIYHWFLYCRDEYLKNKCKYYQIGEKKSFILPLVRHFLYFLECISLKTLYQVYLKKCNGYFFEKYKYKAVELYVFTWLSVDIIFFAYFIHIPLWVILWLLIWRLVDIFQSIFSIGILSEEPLPYSIPRMLILLLVGLIEVSIIYGVFYYINRDIFISINGYSICSKCQSLYHSVTTLTTIGSDFSPINVLGYSIVYSQIIFSVLFLIMVIQRIVSLFKN